MSGSSTTRTVFRGWRVLNTAIILVAFFAPWLDGGCIGDKKTGFSLAVYAGNIVVLSFYFFFIKDDRYVRIGLVVLMLLMGIVCAFIYALVNLVTTLNPKSKYLGYLLLIGAVIAPFSIIFSSGVYWGYFLNCAGLASSIVQEIIEALFFLIRRRSDKLPPWTPGNLDAKDID